MTDLIPAAPGWYIRERDEETGLITHDPVIAWTAGTDEDGEPTILPFIDGGTSCPPLLLEARDFKVFGRCVVYRPNHPLS